MNFPFHYAFKVNDLDSTRRFYGEILECPEGRSTDVWVDFDFFGHQISAHTGKKKTQLELDGKVDGIPVPIPHFGCVLDQANFERIRKQLEDAKVIFLIPPKIRHQGKPGEQRTLFVLDFSDNPLEFKCFLEHEQLFSS